MLKARKYKRLALLAVVFAAVFIVPTANCKAALKYLSLKNGIGVIVREDHRHKVVAVQTWVKSGAAKEVKDLKGVSHFIEHMVFKGTKSKTGKEMCNTIKSKGGYINAATSYDFTRYYVALPSKYLKTALEIEADILKNSLFNERDIESERKVIQEERKRQLDNPDGFLWLKFMKDNHKDYPYKHSIIGYKNTINNIDRNKIMDYLNKEYVGNNIFIVVVGDVKADDVFREAKKIYGNFLYTKDKQERKYDFKFREKFKFKKIKRKQQKTYFLIGFNIPDMNSKEIYSLDILSTILGAGLSSRLYQRVIAKGVLADDVNAGIFCGKYPGYLLISARLPYDKASECAESIFEEIKKLKEEGINRDELNVALNKAEMSYIESNEDCLKSANNIGYYTLIRDYNYSKYYMEMLRKVKIEEVNEAARKYLKLENCKFYMSYPKHVSGDVFPKVGEIKQLFSKGKANVLKVKMGEGGEKHIKIDRDEKFNSIWSKAKLFNLRGGIKLVFLKDSTFPVVSMYAGKLVGLRNESKKNNGITSFVQKLLLKGNPCMNRKEVEMAIDKIGAKVYPFIDKNMAGLSCYVLSKNFKEAAGIFFKSLLSPTFREEEISKTRKQVLSWIRGKEDDMEVYAEECADKLLYGEEHPYGLSLDGAEESIKTIERKDLVHWHRLMYKPKGMVICVVGDISKKELLNVLRKNLKVKDIKINFPRVNLKFKGNDKVIGKNIVRERKQTKIVYSNVGPPVKDIYYYPFKLFNVAVNGLGGRLFEILREEEGLVYDAYSYLESTKGVGTFKIVVSCDPQNEGKVKKKVKALFEKIKREGITGEEFIRAKQYYEGILLISLQTNRQRARAYMRNELLGKGYKNVENLVNVIRKIRRTDVNRAITKYIDFNKGAWFTVRAKN